MADHPSLQELNRRLAEIQEQLAQLGPEDFAAKYELHKERDRVRDLARESAPDRDARRPSQDLRAELDARKSALEKIEQGMVNTGGMAGGGAGAYEGPLDGMKLNNAIRSAHGTDRLVQRITHLESILAERGDL